jgi:protein-S-isoprenylcysteine O-methyltransferase Ste14
MSASSTAVAPTIPPASSESWRKPASLVFVLCWFTAALLLVPHGFGRGWHVALEMSGFLLLIVAALGRLWAFAYIGGRKNRELCREGPYSLTRNPLYLFSFIGVLGASLALQSPPLCVVSALSFLSYHAFVIRAEEKRLAELFGPAFSRYCTAVPRFWPRLAAPQTTTADLTLSSRLFTRALLEVFWFLAAIVLIEVIEAGKLNGWWWVLNTRF